MMDPVITPRLNITAPPAKINHHIMHDVVILMTDAEQTALKQIIAAAPDDAVFVEYGCVDVFVRPTYATDAASA